MALLSNGLDLLLPSLILSGRVDIHLLPLFTKKWVIIGGLHVVNPIRVQRAFN